MCNDKCCKPKSNAIKDMEDELVDIILEVKEK